MAVYFGEIDTFPKAKADKKQVCKILEESADLLLDECADVVQAIANLVGALGVNNFTFYVEACERRNRERGRYDA